LCHVYGHDVLADAPRIVSAEMKGNQIILTADHAGEGLVAKEGEFPLTIYANDQELSYSWQASSNHLILTLSEPAKEVRMEFARGKWFAVNVFNSADLPMIPFEMVLK